MNLRFLYRNEIVVKSPGFAQAWISKISLNYRHENTPQSNCTRLRDASYLSGASLSKTLTQQLSSFPGIRIEQHPYLSSSCHPGYAAETYSDQNTFKNVLLHFKHDPPLKMDFFRTFDYVRGKSLDHRCQLSVAFCIPRSVTSSVPLSWVKLSGGRSRLNTGLIEKTWLVSCLTPHGQHISVSMKHH